MECIKNLRLSVADHNCSCCPVLCTQRVCHSYVVFFYPRQSSVIELGDVFRGQPAVVSGNSSPGSLFGNSCARSPRPRTTLILTMNATWANWRIILQPCHMRLWRLRWSLALDCLLNTLFNQTAKYEVCSSHLSCMIWVCVMPADPFIFWWLGPYFTLICYPRKIRIWSGSHYLGWGHETMICSVYCAVLLTK